jgi:hypothetical protein
MHLIVKSLYDPYACYAWLEQPHFGCARSYYDVTSRKYSSMSLIIVLVSSTKLVSRIKSSFDMSVYDASWWVPIGKPIANYIQWKTYWYTGWSYVSWDTRLIVAIVFMSTRPAGDCHGLLLGCYLNSFTFTPMGAYKTDKSKMRHWLFGGRVLTDE